VQKGTRWYGEDPDLGGHQNPHGLQPGVCDAEHAALARALESASRKETTPERITVFTDAQAARRRMALEEPGPGQQYAIQARKHIATLRRARPGIIIEIRWRPAHKGIAGNEKVDEWAEIAAEEPDSRGVECLSYLDRVEVRTMPLPRFLAHLKREISQKKRVEAHRWPWAGGRSSKKKYRNAKCQKPDGTVAGSSKWLASRFYLLKTGDSRIRQYLHWARVRPTAQCWRCKGPIQTRDNLFEVSPKWKGQQNILWTEVQKETGRWQSWWGPESVSRLGVWSGSAGFPFFY